MPQSVQQGTGSPAGRGASGRGRQLAWALVPLLSVGIFAFVPFVRLALARRRPLDWAVCGAYIAADVVLLTLASATSVDSPGNQLSGGLIILLWGFSTVHTLVAFRPGAGGPASTAASVDANRQAVEDAEKRMRLRRKARKLHQDNPVLAHELKIGRPDLPRGYDDGGLIDVNHVPAGMLASHLGLTQAEAAAVIAARDELGRFSSADELSAYTELTPDRVDGLRDWLLFCLGDRRLATMSNRDRVAR